MKRLVCAIVFVPWMVSCGGGGEAGGGSGALTPKGGECGVAPPGQCQIDEERSDEKRFSGLNALSKELLDSAHPLHNITLVGGERQHPIGDHVQSVAVILSKWDIEEKADEPIAVRRKPDGNLHAVAQRLRCAADRLVALGASGKPSDLVCWSLELWRVGRAYTQLASKR